MPRNEILLLKVVQSLRDTNRTHRKIYQHLNDEFLIHTERRTYQSNLDSPVDLTVRVSPGVKSTGKPIRMTKVLDGQEPR